MEHRTLTCACPDARFSSNPGIPFNSESTIEHVAVPILWISAFTIVVHSPQLISTGIVARDVFASAPATNAVANEAPESVIATRL